MSGPSKPGGLKHTEEVLADTTRQLDDMTKQRDAALRAGVLAMEQRDRAIAQVEAIAVVAGYDKLMRHKAEKRIDIMSDALRLALSAMPIDDDRRAVVSAALGPQP